MTAGNECFRTLGFAGLVWTYFLPSPPAFTPLEVNGLQQDRI